MPAANYQKPAAYRLTHLKAVYEIYPHDPSQSHQFTYNQKKVLENRQNDSIMDENMPYNNLIDRQLSS